MDRGGSAGDRGQPVDGGFAPAPSLTTAAWITATRFPSAPWKTAAPFTHTAHSFYYDDPSRSGWR